MKTQLLLIGVTILSAVPYAEESSPPEISNTRFATVTLKITTDPKVLPMDDDLGNIINFFSGQNVYRAGYGLLENSHTVWFGGVNIIDCPKEIGGMQVARIGLKVTLAEQDKPMAKEVAQRVIESFKKYLMDEYNDNRKIYIAKAQVYDQRMQEAKARLEEFINEQNKLDRGLMDKQSIRQQLAEHEKERFENALQQAVLTKRIEQLAMHIERLKAEADGLKNDLAGDPQTHAAELAEIRKKLEDQQSARPQPWTQAELDAFAGQRFADRRTEMEANVREHQWQLADEIARLSREHRDGLMQMEELNIRERYLAGWGPGSLSDSLNYEMLEVRIEAAKENLRRADVEMAEIATQMDLLRQPEVIETIFAPQKAAVDQTN